MMILIIDRSLNGVNIKTKEDLKPTFRHIFTDWPTCTHSTKTEPRTSSASECCSVFEANTSIYAKLEPWNSCAELNLQATTNWLLVIEPTPLSQYTSTRKQQVPMITIQKRSIEQHTHTRTHTVIQTKSISFSATHNCFEEYRLSILPRKTK